MNPYGHEVTTDGGPGGPFEVPPLKVKVHKFEDKDGYVTIDYTIAGRPHRSADDLSTLWVSSLISLGAQVNGVANSFAEVQYRQPNHRYIHHRVKAIYNRATKKVDVTISGAKFPTHSVFVNGELRQTVKQGEFAELWQLDTARALLAVHRLRMSTRAHGIVRLTCPAKA